MVGMYSQCMRNFVDWERGVFRHRQYELSRRRYGVVTAAAGELIWSVVSTSDPSFTGLVREQWARTDVEHKHLCV